jgi:uncharacterized protein (DUF1684 family)
MRLHNDQVVVALGLALVMAFSPGCRGPEVEEPVAEVAMPEEELTVPEGYHGQIEDWRKRRDERLRADNGWLTLAGLFWLEEGDNTFGSDASNALVFPAGVPARAGLFRRAGHTVTIEVEAGVTITHDGAPVTTMELGSDVRGEPTLLRLDSFTISVIERGKDDVGIRLKDSNSLVLKEFTGIECFPIDPRWRVRARFEPYDPPKTISIPNAYGTVLDETCLGAVVFDLDRTRCRLEAISEASGDLFLIFSDATSGVSTYGGGRYLYADAPRSGAHVILDFNMAYNPPCSFTPFATCPLPPPQNVLPVAIEAGEKQYGHEHH